jgi:hypothetical protein
MGNLLTEEVGNILTTLLGNVLTTKMGKVLDIYKARSDQRERSIYALLGAVSFPSMEYNNLRQIVSRNYAPQKTPRINR